MSPERARLLGELLREMRDDGGYFPAEAWGEIHRTFAIPYVEVVVVREAAQGHEVLLSRRDADDPNWPDRPWHIPGGIWRVARTLEEACSAVAVQELGIPVVASREVMTYKWPDHPYANPISHVCLCDLAAATVETDTARFWPLTDLPTPLLMHHDRFLQACERRLHRR